VSRDGSKCHTDLPYDGVGRREHEILARRNNLHDFTRRYAAKQKQSGLEH